MLTGTAQETLDLFKDILSDFEETVGSHAKCKLLLSIKNIVSYRQIAQKNFNSLLEEYRAALPDDYVIVEQHSFGRVTKYELFFCGLHLLVGIADTAASTLLQWEATHFSEDPATSSVFVHKSE